MYDVEIREVEQRPPAPQVVTWFKVYAGCLLAVYVLLCGVGLVMFANPDLFVDPGADFSSNRPADQFEARIMASIYFVMGGVFAFAYLLAFFFTSGKGAWIYNLVLICIGLTSCCCIPVCIPLLIFWIRDDCKNWFCQTAS